MCIDRTRGKVTVMGMRKYLSLYNTRPVDVYVKGNVIVLDSFFGKNDSLVLEAVQPNTTERDIAEGLWGIMDCISRWRSAGALVIPGFMVYRLNSNPYG